MQFGVYAIGQSDLTRVTWIQLVRFIPPEEPMRLCAAAQNLDCVRCCPEFQQPSWNFQFNPIVLCGGVRVTAV
jgi:hypothetical protein